MTLIEKARAGRIAALASLATEADKTDNVVSLFDFTRSAKADPAPTPKFHSIRVQGEVVRLAA
ncbi:hypothetical protein [Maritimibacter dapengensis]|uniref:Uncharacterized protein n=1 Tax=Maritimibacter dapengensis TaxID=2836868 RepID=A0ABS6SWU8_9RHOB|nr:hypothetical protein [Maritimibacter dapengensis]MBV7377390.1 hypothetical protein [Maritimibacter dapengensis]